MRAKSQSSSLCRVTIFQTQECMPLYIVISAVHAVPAVDPRRRHCYIVARTVITMNFGLHNV